MVKKISVSDEAYELLIKLRDELGVQTHSEAILVLAERARNCGQLAPVVQELEYRLRKVELLLSKITEERPLRHRRYKRHVEREEGGGEGGEQP